MDIEYPSLVSFHPTQDPISHADGSTHAMGTGSKQGCATVDVAFGGDVARCLNARHDSSPCADRGMDVVRDRMSVRRLTPTECERLQGFPDGWTERAGETAFSDSTRYKMLGNAVCVNVSEWIARRMFKRMA